MKASRPRSISSKRLIRGLTSREDSRDPNPPEEARLKEESGPRGRPTNERGEEEGEEE